MDRKRKPKEPCGVCFLRQDLCLCPLIPKLKLKSKLSLLIHYKELKRTSNTGRLAIEALENSQMLIRGLVKQNLDTSSLLDPNYQSLLLFPSENSETLNQNYLKNITKPIHLIVPDGNWRQASKVHTRHPEIGYVPRVHIEAINSDTQFLRLETTENGMATLQAIAHAFGVIESEEVRNQLLTLYKEKLQRTLKARGQQQ